MESPSEVRVRQALEALRFQVERLPERKGTRVADYRATDGTHTYLAEVRKMEPDLRQRSAHFLDPQAGPPRPVTSPQHFAEEVNDKGAATFTRMMERDQKFEDVVADKADQLADTPYPADFRTIWIVHMGEQTAIYDDANFLCEKLWRTLYGVVDLHGKRGFENGATDIVPVEQHTCLYYHEPTFHKVRHVNAVGFVTKDVQRLLVNDLADNSGAFRESNMYREFQRNGWLFDPANVPPGVLVLDAALDRSAPRAQWSAIRAKYGLYVVPVMDACLDGLIAVPVPPELRRPSTS